MTNILEIFRSIESAKVIAPKIDYIDYIQLDLSVSNLELHNHKLETASDYEIFIQKYLTVVSQKSNQHNNRTSGPL